MKEISGDKKQGVVKIFYYLFFNFCRGVLGYITWPPLVLGRFYPSQKPTTSDSPSRFYVDAFICEELPRLLPRATISVLDIGAGSGYVRDLLFKAGYGGEYTGIDIKRHRNFTEAHQAFQSKLLKISAENFTPSCFYDLIISVTALEHMENDKKIFLQSASWLKQQGVLLFVVPSFWALFTYLLHGYRQYNPKKIKKITAGKNTRIYGFGGIGTFLLHLLLITLPERLAFSFFRSRSWYPSMVSAGLSIDRYFPWPASMYAIVYLPSKNA